MRQESKRCSRFGSPVSARPLNPERSLSLRQGSPKRIRSPGVNQEEDDRSVSASKHSDAASILQFNDCVSAPSANQKESITTRPCDGQDEVAGFPDPGLDSDVDQYTENNPVEQAAPQRLRKKISPSSAKLTMEEGPIADQNALKDAESIWGMVTARVYGDPTCPESDFSELAVRFAQRGLRWVQLAMRHGVTAANRMIRGGSRAKFGYGILKPANPPKLFTYHAEYDRAKQKYST